MSPTTGVAVTILGPDTLFANQTATYRVTISGGPGIKGGTDIAASNGTLSAVSSSLKKVGTELTHRSATNFSMGALSFEFSYTAPSTPGTQTLYATGNSVNGNGNNSGDQWNWAPNKTLTVVSLTSIEENNTGKPLRFELAQNFPNPFNPATVIRYSLLDNSNISLKVYDVRGTEIATLVEGFKEAGEYRIDFHADELSSGVYLYTFRAENFIETRKMFFSK